MSKKIILTNYENKTVDIDIDIDDIEHVGDVEGRTFIDTKDRCCHFVKESKSRVLKMIEAAK